MSYIFNHPTDNMNYRKFMIYVTGSYEPLLPEYFKEHDIPPFYDEVDNYAVSYVTSATIVDLCYHNKEFTMKDIDDTVAIIEIIESYINLANNAPYIDQELNAYLNRCKGAVKKLKEAYNSYLNYLKNKYPDKYQEKLSLLEILNNKKIGKLF